MVAVGRPDSEIGLVVGAASVFLVVVSLAVGGMVDLYGGRLLFLVGAGLLFFPALLFALGIVGAGSPLPALLAVRFIQGAGLAALVPAALSLVPGLVSDSRLPTALAAVGVAANVSLAIVPPITLVMLESYGLGAVAVAAALSSAAAALLLIPRVGSARRPSRPDGSRRFRLAWRPEWTGPLVSCGLFIVHWGVITSYLPQRAEAAGADIGLFFTGDAVALLAARIPGGYLVGRLGSLRLMVIGLVVTGASVTLLLLPLTTPLLIAAGVGTGLGAALVLPAVLVELSRRSGPADRGSAFGLFSVAFGVGITVGSIGAAPLIEPLGFNALLVVGIVMALLAAVVAAWDDRRFGGIGPAAPASVDAAALAARAAAETEVESTGV